MLNPAFSLQAAYAAPLILLAQTRQADRDKVDADADARQRGDLAHTSETLQIEAAAHPAIMTQLLKQNTKLKEMTKQITGRVETLTKELHAHMIRVRGNASAPSVEK